MRYCLLPASHTTSCHCFSWCSCSLVPSLSPHILQAMESWVGPGNKANPAEGLPVLSISSSVMIDWQTYVWLNFYYNTTVELGIHLCDWNRPHLPTPGNNKRCLLEETSQNNTVPPYQLVFSTWVSKQTCFGFRVKGNSLHVLEQMT